MTDGMGAAIGVYVLVFVLVAIVARIWMDDTYRKGERRTAATVVLLSPVWPVLVVWVLIFGIWKLLLIAVGGE